MVWYSHLFQNFPQFLVIHTVQGFGIVDKAEIDVLLELSCSFDDPAHVGNLEVVKQEMARVNVDIPGINELRWTGKGEFNSDDHYMYYCGQESLRRNEVAIMVNKSLKCSTWMQSQNQQNDLCSFPRQTIQYHSNSSLCPNQ